jgi:predicted methyltransferase
MTMVKQLIGAAALCLAASAALGDALQAAVDGDHRTDAFAARDEYRNPVETLRFFEVEPHHTVVEIWPGAGWYTEILAPYLQEDGVLYAAHFPENTEVEYFQKSRSAFMNKLAEKPPVYGTVVVTEFGPGSEQPPAPLRTVDRVLTFRNVHNWLNNEFIGQAFADFYAVLEPGGILGVVEHRAKPGTSVEDMMQSGYMTEEYVIKMATRAGFELVAKSDINANPDDAANHPKGVWTLPPSLALGEKDREKYLNIGESDRMTLKFRKPPAEKEVNSQAKEKAN